MLEAIDDRAGGVGVDDGAAGEDRQRAVQRGERAVAVRGPRHRATEEPQFEHAQRRERVRGDELGDRVHDLIAQLPHQEPVAASRHRRLGIARDPHEGGRADRPERVQNAPVGGAQRVHQSLPVPLAAEVRRDHGDGATAQRRRHGVDGWQVEVAEHGAHRLGRVHGPAAELLEHRGGLVGRPHQHAGGDVGDRVRLELRRGHDRKPPAAAAQRPEQLRLGLRVCSQPLALRRDNLERLDVVRRQAVRPAQPAGSAAERQAHDAHGRGKAEDRSEAMLARGVGDLTGTHARLDARDPLVRSDLDLAHR
jgi:hypothetical protein